MSLTKEDIDGLFKLLAIFRPNDPHLNDQRLRSAWRLVLEPFEKDEVREAVAAWFRESSYWPDVSEIAARCPWRGRPAQRQEAERRGGQACQDESVEQLRTQWAALAQKRKAAEIPATITEARAAGLSAAAWSTLLELAGLGLGAADG